MSPVATYSPGLSTEADLTPSKSLVHRLTHFTSALLRASVLAVLYPIALADAAGVRIFTAPSGAALAHARAAWIHRWSRAVRRVLAVQLGQHGYTAVSGIVAASHGTLLDVILFASVRPCVFVAGAEVRRWPVIGRLARLGGTLFFDRRRHHDVARMNFMIQRMVQRRLLVVIFPVCSGLPTGSLRSFASALFQPAAELRCTLTAAAIDSRADDCFPAPACGAEIKDGVMHRVAQFVPGCEARAVVAFGPPAFRHGGRKNLARQVRDEILDLKLRTPQPA